MQVESAYTWMSSLQAQLKNLPDCINPEIIVKKVVSYVRKLIKKNMQ